MAIRSSYSSDGLTDVSRTEIWAQLFLCAADSARIRDFFVKGLAMDGSYVARRMHLTVYHALGAMPGVSPLSEKTCVTVAAIDTRFMVMTPGGEVARPGVEPSDHKVAVRVQNHSVAMEEIIGFRNRLIEFESAEILGERSSSTRKRSAFGAPRFQPHMTVLTPGNGLPRDLTPIGARFRETLGNLTFDRFIIDVSTRAPRVQQWQAHLAQHWGRKNDS